MNNNNKINTSILLKSRLNMGFTLIEIMIVVAIIALLSSIALPSYINYINRGKITDVMIGLPEYSVKMEQYFQDNRNYGAQGSGCPVSVTSSKFFTYSCTVGNATPSTTYAATATSIMGSLGKTTGDYTYTLNQANSKSTTKFKGSVVSKSCWLVKGSEC